MQNKTHIISLSIFILVSLLFSVGLCSAEGFIITSPVNMSNFTTTSVPINYTLTGTNYSNYNYSCGYNLVNSIGSTLKTFACSDNTTIADSTQGNNTANLYVNVSNSTFSFINTSSISFIVDSISPIVSISYPQNGIYYNASISTINYSSEVNTSLSLCWFTINAGVANTTIPCGRNITGLTSAEGSNTWVIYNKDLVGNIGSHSISFTIDTRKPVLKSLEVLFTSSLARIYYETNESVNVTIKYGNISTVLNINESKTDFSDDSYISLSSLINNMTYYYNLTICDRTNNCLTNGTNSFLVNFTITPIVTPTCYTDALCSEWGACTATGLQTRTCNKILINCSYSVIPATTRICNNSIQPDQTLYTAALADDTALVPIEENAPMSDGMKIFLYIVGAIIVVGIIVFIFMYFRDPNLQDIPQESDYSNNPNDFLGDNA